MFDKTLQLTLRNWTSIQVLPLSVDQEYSKRSVVQIDSDEVVNPSSTQLQHPTSRCVSTSLSVSNLTNQSQEHSYVTSYDLFDVIETPEVTWQDVVSRILALPVDNGVFDDQTIQSIHLICDDLRTLSMNQSNYLLQLEDVDRDTIFWFAAAHATTKQSIIKARIEQDSSDTKSAVNPFVSIDHSLDFAYFHCLSHVFVNHAVYNRQDLTDDILCELRIRTLLLRKSTLLKPWLYRLNCALELYKGDKKTLQTHKWIALQTVELSDASTEVLSCLKHASALRALRLDCLVEDSQCQQLAASLKFFPDIKTFDVRLGDVSKATGLMLVKSISKFCQGLVMLNIDHFCVDDRLMLAVMFQSLVSLSVLSLRKATESVFAACVSVLSNAKSIIKLSFSECDITRKCCQSLSSTLHQLKWLSQLSFTNCSFDKVPEADELMHCIGKCAMLQQLTLRCCTKLTWSTRYITVPLLRLDVSDSKEVDLADMQRLARTCPDLVCLDLSSTITMQLRDGADLAVALGTWPHLKVFRLRALPMSSTHQVCARVSLCADLVDLDLANLSLDANAAVVLSLQQQHLTQLRKFDVSGNNISGKAGVVLARNLQHLTDLEHLNISKNNVACVELRDAIRLSHLNMSEIGLEVLHCHMFGSAFSTSSQITHLDISSNLISSHGFAMLSATGMQKLQLMRSFKASNTGLDGSSCRPIGLMTRAWLELWVLDLSDNAFRDDGIIEFAQTTKMIFVYSLRLDNCSFGDRGLKAIAKAVLGMQVLRAVSIGKNKLSRVGYKLAISDDHVKSVLRTDYN